MKTRFTALLAAAAIMLLQQTATATPAAAQVEGRLKRLYPNTRFEAVKKTPVDNLYEVKLGQNIAYVEPGGRYFIFGVMYDMKEQKDLAAGSRAAAGQDTFRNLPFKNAITVEKGNGGKGKREFALFTDPDCPFCKRLEETLAGMTDYTVHVFLYPIAALHPQAVHTAERIWCSKNKVAAWNDYMLLDKEPSAKRCSNPVYENIALADKLGIRGTPSMIHKDGRRVSGALSRANLEKWINGDE